MEILSLEQINIIKDIRNLLILKKDIKNLRQEKETKAIKGSVLRHMQNLFEHEKNKKQEEYYKPVRVSKF